MVHLKDSTTGEPKAWGEQKDPEELAWRLDKSRVWLRKGEK